MGRAVQFDILVDDSKGAAGLRRFRGDLEKTDKQIDETGKRGASMSNMLGGLAIGAGAAYSIDEAEQAEVAERQMAAAIEATGNAAHVSAKEQADYADALGRKIAVDNDDLMNAGTRLRRYKEIKDQRFNETLAISADVAAAKNLELTAAVDKVGKALNNPIAASKLLRSVGVELTAQQKQQIETMVEAGDVAGAQGILLDELSKRYSGSAEAAVTGSQRAKVAMADTAETVGKVLTPAMEAGADAAGFVADGLSRLPEPLQAATVGAVGLAYAGPKVVEGLSKIPPAGRKVIDFLESATDKGSSAANTIAQLSAGIGGLPAVSALGATGLSVLTVEFIQSRIEAQRAKDDIGDLQRSISDGMSPIEAAAEKLNLTLNAVDGGFQGLSGSSKDFKRDLKELGYSTADVAEMIALPGDEWKKMREEILTNKVGDEPEDIYNLVDNLELMRKRMREAAAQDKDLKAGHKDLVEAGIIPATNATKDNTAATSANVDTQKGWIGPVTEANQKWQEQAAAIGAVNDELDENVSKAGDAFDASMSLTDAEQATTDARQALAEARKSGDPKEIAAAEEELTKAIARQAEAKVDLARKEAEAEGHTLDAAEAASIQRGAIESLMSQTDLTSESLQKLVDRLKEAEKDHKVGLDTLAAEEAAKRLRDTLREAWFYKAALNSEGGGGGIPASTVPGGSTGTIGYTGGLGGSSTPAPVVPPGRMPPDLRSGPTLNLNVGTLNVTGTGRDLEAAVERAGARLARRVKAA